MLEIDLRPYKTISLYFLMIHHYNLVTCLQSDIGELEKSREAMARELVNLSTDNEQLEFKVEDFGIVQKQLQVSSPIATMSCSSLTTLYIHFLL